MVYNRINLIVILLLITACGRNQYQAPIPVITQIQGVWHFEDSVTKKITVGAPLQGAVNILFPYQLHAPSPKPIEVVYRYTACDTVWCSDGNIYPDCFFYHNNGKVEGMMQEDAEKPGKGSYKRIVKE
jgi:hypothetical protein